MCYDNNSNVTGNYNTAVGQKFITNTNSFMTAVGAKIKRRWWCKCWIRLFDMETILVAIHLYWL